MSKQNAKGKITMEELMAQGGQALELTDAEKISFGIMLEKARELQAELQKVNVAIAGMVAQSVRVRGLDPNKYGVNLAAGRILPLETPAIKSPGGDGKEAGG